MKTYIEDIFEILDIILRESIIENYHLYDPNDKDKKIEIKENKNSISFLTFNNVLIHFYPKKTKTTIDIRFLNNNQLSNIKEKFQNVRYKAGDLYIFIDIVNINEINLLKQEILEIHKYLFLNESVDFFGCCSRYLECSDNKKCLCTDIIFRLGCLYKKNLESNKIFYGKNKNVI